MKNEDDNEDTGEFDISDENDTKPTDNYSYPNNMYSSDNNMYPPINKVALPPVGGVSKQDEIEDEISDSFDEDDDYM